MFVPGHKSKYLFTKDELDVQDESRGGGWEAAVSKGTLERSWGREWTQVAQAQYGIVVTKCNETNAF